MAEENIRPGIPWIQGNDGPWQQMGQGPRIVEDQGAMQEAQMTQAVGQASLSQSEQLYLRQLQSGRLNVEHQMRQGIIPPQQAGQMLQQMGQQAQPLMVRASQLPMLQRQLQFTRTQREMQFREEQLQTAATFRARSLADRITTVGGVSFMETGPGSFTPLPTGLQANAGASGRETREATAIRQRQVRQDGWITSFERSFMLENDGKRPDPEEVRDHVLRRQSVDDLITPPVAAATPATGTARPAGTSAPATAAPGTTPVTGATPRTPTPAMPPELAELIPRVNERVAQLTAQGTGTTIIADALVQIRRIMPLVDSNRASARERNLLREAIVRLNSFADMPIPASVPAAPIAPRPTPRAISINPTTGRPATLSDDPYMNPRPGGPLNGPGSPGGES